MSNRGNKRNSNDSTPSNTDIDELSDLLNHETNDEHEIKSITSVTPSASTITDKKNGKVHNANCHDTNETHDIDNQTTISVTPSGSTNFEFSIPLSKSVVRLIDPRSLSRSIVVEESHIESRGNVMLY